MKDFFLNFIIQVYAQADTGPNINDINFPDSNFGSIGDIFTTTISWMLGTAALLAVIALVYSGIMFITAGANADQAEKARKNVTWAVIGIVIVILALVIVQWVNNIINTGEA